MRALVRVLAACVAFGFGFCHIELPTRQHGAVLALGAPAYASNPCYNDSCGDPNYLDNLDPNKMMTGGPLPPDCARPCVGNPINFATGNKFQAETDYVGAGVYPIVFTRHYNSQDASSAHEFGLGWRGAYSRSLLRLGSTIFITRDDGAIYTFKSIGNAWQPDHDVNVRLTATATGWSYVDAQDQTETYDATGRLVSVANRAGVKHTLAYDAQGRLQTVTDPAGRVLTFAYAGSASKLVASVTTPGAKKYQYAYDAGGRLIAMTDPSNHLRKYLYENVAFPNLLTGIIDENNKRYATFAYDADQRATSTEHAGGADRYTVDYTKIATGIIVVTSPLGGVTLHGLKALNGTAVENAAMRNCGDNCAGSVSYSTRLYDENGNLLQFKSEGGNYTAYTFDLTRNLETSRTVAPGSPDERVISTFWHPTFRLPVKIVDSDRIRIFTYDAKGNLLTFTLQSPTVTSTWRLTYNAFGEVVTVTDPLGRVTIYDYDDKGNLIRIANALNQVVQITSYDANGRPLSITDPNGTVTTLTYNFRGQIASRKVGQRVTAFAYDLAGNLIRIKRPDGSFLSATYDAAHRLIRITDALGNYVKYTLDAAGDRVGEDVFDSANVRKRTHSWSYDSFGRIKTDVGASEQTSTYSSDANDLLTNFNDPNGEYRSWSYDSHRRLAYYGSGNGTVTFTYDDHGNISAIGDEKSHYTIYDHTGLDQLKTIWSPDTGVTDRSFNVSGNLTLSLDDRGISSTYAYDKLDRPTKVTYSSGEKTTLQYDVGTNGIGHLTGMTDSSGSTAWAYDAYGAVIQRQQKIGAITLTTQWNYDPVKGQLLSIVYPSGAVAAYSYDAAGRISGIALTPSGGVAAPLVSQVAYFPFGPVASWVGGNGATYTRTFDKDGRITQSVMAASKKQAFKYDLGGRIKTISESGLAQKSFGYTTGNRLYSYIASSKTQYYNYDPVGNRTNLTSYTSTGSTSQDYAYARFSNRLLRVTGSSTEDWQYDATGNVVSDIGPGGSRAFAFDGPNRQRYAKLGALLTRFKVDGLGQRVAKYSSTNAPLSFVQYDLGGHVLGQYSSTGGLTQETIWLGDLPIGVVTPAGTFYVAPDQLGAPHQITNAAQQVVWLWDHDPFGNGRPTGTFTYDLRFPGQLYDSETGNHYNYYRDYDPRIGRYIESDPIGLAGGTNTYAYVGGNPVNNIDPNGLIIWDVLDFGFFAQSAYEYSKCASAENALNLALDTIGLLPLIPSLGALRRLEKAAEDATTVIGRVKDLQSLQHGERSLLDRLPDLGSPKANWSQNSGVLRQEMSRGMPIRDASPGDTGGQFLNAERNLLKDRGWTFDSQTNYWMPPKP